MVVDRVEHDASGVVATCHSAEGGGGVAATSTVRADAIVITVPLQVLKDGDITFSPPLPEAKITAIDACGMERGAMKLLLGF